MVNGSGDKPTSKSEAKFRRPGIRFRDNQQLLNICQRIVSQIGRAASTKSSPICDARLPDGSRVKRHRSARLRSMVPAADPFANSRRISSTSSSWCASERPTPEGGEILKVIGRCRVNTIVSGGNRLGQGRTLLNCLTRYIDDDERIITCEGRRRACNCKQTPYRSAGRTRPSQPRRRGPDHHARTSCANCLAYAA